MYVEVLTLDECVPEDLSLAALGAVGELRGVGQGHVHVAHGHVQQEGLWPRRLLRDEPASPSHTRTRMRERGEPRLHGSLGRDECRMPKWGPHMARPHRSANAAKRSLSVVRLSGCSSMSWLHEGWPLHWGPVELYSGTPGPLAHAATHRDTQSVEHSRILRSGSHLTSGRINDEAMHVHHEVTYIGSWHHCSRSRGEGGQRPHCPCSPYPPTRPCAQVSRTDKC